MTGPVEDLSARTVLRKVIRQRELEQEFDVVDQHGTELQSGCEKCGVGHRGRCRGGRPRKAVGQ